MFPWQSVSLETDQSSGTLCCCSLGPPGARPRLCHFIFRPGIDSGLTGVCVSLAQLARGLGCSLSQGSGGQSTRNFCLFPLDGEDHHSA